MDLILKINHTTGYSDGYHTIYCRAYDPRGNMGHAQKVVGVSNNPPHGCPNLLVWNGDEFVDEGVLNIHNDENPYEDVTVTHQLATMPAITKPYRYTLKLSEIGEGYSFSHSFIIQVELFAKTINGRWVKLPLISAFHSTKGNVKRFLKYNDNRWAETYIGDEITLEFLAKRPNLYIEFKFVIIGHNPVKEP